jgi:hypothetical protein
VYRKTHAGFGEGWPETPCGDGRLTSNAGLAPVTHSLRFPSRDAPVTSENAPTATPQADAKRPEVSASADVVEAALAGYDERRTASVCMRKRRAAT